MFRFKSILLIHCVVLWFRIQGEEFCEPALNQLVQHGVASSALISHIPSNGSEICGGGPCCTPNMSKNLEIRGRYLLHDVVQRGTVSLLKAVKGAKESFTESIEKTLLNSERQCLDTFQRLYPRLVGHAKEPLRELFASLRSSLSSTDGGSAERALSTFWDELFPLVYHSTVHSNLAPFSPAYMNCLKKSNSNINPWKVVPNLIGEAISKGLDTARLMIQVLSVGYEVILNSRNYEIPEECGIPAARMYFCTLCHGAVVPPCAGLCVNVARGCFAPLVEIDGAWNELGTAATRVEESIKNSGLIQLLKDLPDRFSDAIMVAMESGTKLQKMARKNCGPHVHEESKEWEAKSKEGLTQNRPEFHQLRGQDWNSTGNILELRAAESAAILSGSRHFWVRLADGACAHLSVQETNCWNGFKVEAYTRPAVNLGVTAQKYNPEVQVARPDTSVYVLADQLRAVKRLVTKQLNWMPESDSFRSDAFEGSGIDTSRAYYPNHDDEDADDDGEGSGFGSKYPNDNSNSRKGKSDHELPNVAGSSSHQISFILLGTILSIMFLTAD